MHTVVEAAVLNISKVSSQVQSARRWVWASLILQFLGYVVDVVWHGLLNPGVEPSTVSEMVKHLATVHLPLYSGAAAVLVSTSAALVRQITWSPAGVALPIALGGAVLSAASEGWHAYFHLRLDTAHAPVAGSLSFIGFVVVVVAMSLSGVSRRRGPGGAGGERRTAQLKRTGGPEMEAPWLPCPPLAHHHRWQGA